MPEKNKLTEETAATWTFDIWACWSLVSSLWPNYKYTPWHLSLPRAGMWQCWEQSWVSAPATAWSLCALLLLLRNVKYVLRVLPSASLMLTCHLKWCCDVGSSLWLDTESVVALRLAFHSPLTLVFLDQEDSVKGSGGCEGALAELVPLNSCFLAITGGLNLNADVNSACCFLGK